MTNSVFQKIPINRNVFINSKGCNELILINNYLSSPCFKIINELYQKFMNGNFEYVQKKLTLDKYNTLALDLYKLKIGNNKNYEKIRKNNVNSFESLNQSIIVYNKICQMEETIEQLREKLCIFDDINKIKEHLQKLQKSFKLISVNVRSPLYTVKREVVLYIRQYGYPENGIFDADKMGYIMENLC